MNLTRRFLSIIIILILIACLCACEGDVSLQTAKYKGGITVGYYSGSYLNEPVVNVIKNIARSMDLEVYLKTQTKETWQADLHNGDIDLMIDEDNGVDLLSSALFSTKVLFIKSADADLVNGGLVGVMDVGFIRDSADAITDFHSGEYVYYAIPNMIVEDFSSGYLDAIVINEVDYLSYSELGDKTYDIINYREVKVVFNEGSHTLCDEFNSQLKTLKESGLISNLVYIK